jgi:hypothetical protein
VRVEKLSLGAVRHVVRLATDSVAAEAARVRGLSPASAVKRQAPLLQASLGMEIVHSKRLARVSGRERLAAELDTQFPLTISGAELDLAASFVAAAGITSAWGSAALQAIATESPLTRLSQAVASQVERTVATEVARAFNDERHGILLNFGLGLEDGGPDGVGDSGRPAPGMFKVLSAVLDGRTCERCFGSDGEVLELHKSFRSGTPPFHPRCRCIVEHVIVSKPERLEDIKIDYDLFKAELRDIIRENRIVSDRQALSFVSDSMGSKRSAEVLSKRFHDERYATPPRKNP